MRNIKWCKVPPTRKTDNAVNLSAIEAHLKIQKILDRSIKICCSAIDYKLINCGGIFMHNDTFETIIKKTRQLICSEEFIQKHRIWNGFTRSRKLSFPNNIYLILAAGKKSIGANCAEVCHDFSSLPPTCFQTGDLKRTSISLWLFICTENIYFYLTVHIFLWFIFKVNDPSAAFCHEIILII